MTAHTLTANDGTFDTGTLMPGQSMGSAAVASALAAFIAACGGSSKSKSKPAKTANTATKGTEEAQHFAALKKVASSLGHPVSAPKLRFPIHSASQVTKLAATVENLGAAAYLGQAPRIQSKEILAAALAIHSVEGRHAATLNDLLHKSPTPDGAFAKPMSMAEVLPIVKPFIVS